MGIMVGELTSAAANVQVRLTSSDTLIDRDLPGLAGTVVFQLYKEGSEQLVAKQILKASQQRDFIARATFRSLDPATRYRCETELTSSAGVSQPGPQARFKTLPAIDAPAEVRFVVVTGMNYAKFHGDDRIDQKQHKVENNTNLPAPYAGVDKHLDIPRWHRF